METSQNPEPVERTQKQLWEVVHRPCAREKKAGPRRRLRLLNYSKNASISRYPLKKRMIWTPSGISR